jgi:hypothetical protein
MLISAAGPQRHEIVEEGRTGLLVDDVDGMARAIYDAKHLDRGVVRARARDRWSADRMACGYEAICGRCL